MLLEAALLAVLVPPTCVPSLAVGELPVRGCFLFSKYGEPDCGPSPTWEVDDSYTLSYWALPLTSIKGPYAGIAEVEGPEGTFEVTVTGSTGATRTKLFEMLEGGACEEVEP